MTSYTPKLDLAKQDTGAQGWGTVLNQNFDKIDAGFGEIGVKVYSATVTYASGEFVIASVSGVVGLYKSLQGNNVGHALTDTTWWEAVPLSGSADVDGKSITKNSSDELQTVGVINQNDITTALNVWGGDEADLPQNLDSNTLYFSDDGFLPAPDIRNLGQIITSTIPLVDAGLHLLDGSLISGAGSYSAFVDYVSGLVSSHSNLFCSEADWQTSNTTYGACDKFVYNSTNNTIRLPKRSTVHGALIYSYSNGSTHYRIYSDGWCEQSWHANAGASANALISLPKAFKDTNYTVLGLTRDCGDAYPEGVATWPYSGSQFYAISAYNGTFYGTECTWYACGYVDISDYQQHSVYEYIVIATSTKTEIEVDIDDIATDLNGKADVDLTNCTKPHIIDTYINGTSWYRVYSDGWCEQGGITSGKNSTNDSIILLKEYSDTNYVVTATNVGGTSDYIWAGLVSKSTDSFVLAHRYYGMWRASGYLTQGEY